MLASEQAKVHLGAFLDCMNVKVEEETLHRIVRMYRELFVETHSPPFSFTTFPNPENLMGMVVVRDIRFYSMCEHHLIPFFGVAHVGYLPHERIVGLSKIPRLVDWYARRPQLQERMTKQIASYLETELRPKGVAVLIEATHLCMVMRGVMSPDALTSTEEFRGTFLASGDVRDEFFALVGRKE